MTLHRHTVRGIEDIPTNVRAKSLAYLTAEMCRRANIGCTITTDGNDTVITIPPTAPAPFAPALVGQAQRANIDAKITTNRIDGTTITIPGGAIGANYGQQQ